MGKGVSLAGIGRGARTGVGYGMGFSRCGQGGNVVQSQDLPTGRQELEIPPRLKSDRVFFGSYIVAGVTRDSTGAPLAGCVVQLFNSDHGDALEQSTISDGSGNYQFSVGDNGPRWLRLEKAGPNRAGVTVNDVIPAPV